MGQAQDEDRGSVVALLAIVLLVVAMVTVSIVATAVGSVRVADAQWAADATALAIAAEGVTPAGIEAGRAVAEANGANLLTVSVEVDSRPGTGPIPAPPDEQDNARRMSTVVAVDIEREGVRAQAAAGVLYSQDP